MDVKKATTSTGFKLSVMTLAIMNITAVVSLRGLPAEAVYGLSSAFYYLFAAVVFLIPTAMVAAELAAMFSDKQGGVFRWVGEAYGARTGFLAIWLQWIESTIWYPTVLTFGAVSIAFIGMNETYDMSLASNKVFTLVVVLAIYWIATFVSLKGMDWVGKISKWGGMIGTIIPRQVCSSFWVSFTFRPEAITIWICRKVSSPTCRISTTWYWPAASSSSMPVWR